MEICTFCSLPLHRAQQVEHDGQTFKSCPKCSASAGYHVFYPIEDFGDRNMGDGRNIVQSWCSSCRNNADPVLAPAFTCN